jgi:hypothetical protein
MKIYGCLLRFRAPLHDINAYPQAAGIETLYTFEALSVSPKTHLTEFSLYHQDELPTLIPKGFRSIRIP